MRLAWSTLRNWEIQEIWDRIPSVGSAKAMMMMMMMMLMMLMLMMLMLMMLLLLMMMSKHSFCTYIITLYSPFVLSESACMYDLLGCGQMPPVECSSLTLQIITTQISNNHNANHKISPRHQTLSTEYTRENVNQLTSNV